MKNWKNKKGNEYLLLDVPEETKHFILANSRSGKTTCLLHCGIDVKTTKSVQLPQGNYELIGLAKDVSEEVAKQIIGQIYTEEEYNKSSIQLYRYELDKVVQSLGVNNPIILKLFL